MAVRALITAGGTRDSIDDVRLSSHVGITTAQGITHIDHFDVDNFARGTFGLEIAKAFASRGVEVTLVGSRDLLRTIGTALPGIRTVPFRSFKELQRALDVEIPASKPDFVLMTAAIADYSPQSVEGKLSSDQDELIIRCTRNPKLLDRLRELAGSSATLVGFKLLSGVTDEQLEAVARAQIVRAGLDVTVGNDFKRIDWERGVHPIVVVRKNAGTVSIVGHRPEVAAKLVETLLGV